MKSTERARRKCAGFAGHPTKLAALSATCHADLTAPFYQRVHAPTLGTTLGAGCILVGSMICFSVLESRPVIHEVVIALFVTLTTPVTLMLLARAALYRDRTEGEGDVPRDFD